MTVTETLFQTARHREEAAQLTRRDISIGQHPCHHIRIFNAKFCAQVATLVEITLLN
jgi:hypothetical protein